MRRWGARRPVARNWTLAAGLGGCARYHQEVAALRMARPPANPPLAAYAAAAPAYPSVGGDILKGTGSTVGHRLRRHQRRARPAARALRPLSRPARRRRTGRVVAPRLGCG